MYIYIYIYIYYMTLRLVARLRVGGGDLALTFAGLRWRWSRRDSHKCYGRWF